MFRSIKGALTQRQEDLHTQSSVSVLVRQAVLAYISETYPGAGTVVSAQYKQDERLLVISTPSKTLAGELTFNAGEIRSYLTQHHIKVSRIVVR